LRPAQGEPDVTTASKPAAGRHINWLNVLTVVSAAILISAEVFGAAFAGGWAIANLFQLGDQMALVLQIAFFVLGFYVMTRFVQNARKVEPFTSPN
jgi:uncharacterized membrane protein